MQGSFDDLFDDLPVREGRMNIRRDLTQRVATVMDAERSSRLYLQFMRGEISADALDEGLADCILEAGMTRAEIEAHFPPYEHRGLPPSELSFNRKALIATILWQEWKWVGQNRPPGNIRHFWYTHLMYTLMRVMGDTKIASIFTCYNEVLRELVQYEGFRYADLNLVSTKSKLCEAIFADSPYPNIILACEKESYHQYLKRLAHVFHITFISLGGQGSYGAFEDLVMQFLEAGIDIHQEFRLFTVSDFDPQGYDIQAAAQKHLEDAGLRQVTIDRVYLRPEHITDGVVERFAVPYEVQKKKATATKSACTLYNKFGALTGGIYKRNGTWQRFPMNGDGSYQVPQLTESTQGYELARVELDNFQDEVLLHLLIDALERVIDGAAYYYAAAQQIWRRTFTGGVVDAAKALILKAVAEHLRPWWQRLHDLNDRLDARWEDLTAAEEDLISDITDARDARVDALQARIDEIQRQIDALRAEQAELEEQQRTINDTADDIEQFLHVVEVTVIPKIPAAQREVTAAEALIEGYRDEHTETMATTVAERFDATRVPIREVVNLEGTAGHVFERARAGAQTFQAPLAWAVEQRIMMAARDDLEAQQEELTVEVPPLADDLLTDVDQHLQEAETLLSEAQRVPEETLSDGWQGLLRELRTPGYNPWWQWRRGQWQR
jgi:hypothetical protein